jgi:hypothetical protein
VRLEMVQFDITSTQAIQCVLTTLSYLTVQVCCTASLRYIRKKF